MIKVLHISGQKPNSTGSGIYLSGLIKGFKESGIKNALVMGLNHDDNLESIKNELDGVDLFPLYFESDKLDFALPGMSDTMPYRSTRYMDMTEKMLESYIDNFRENISLAIDNFKPDVIISHHLYLVTALTKTILDKCLDNTGKKIPLFAICHGTCLRQLQAIQLDHPSYNNKWIIENIKNLDRIFSLHMEQKRQILNIFDQQGDGKKLDENKIEILGSGFNERYFNTSKKDFTDEDFREIADNKDRYKLIFAGKIAKVKGLLSLLSALESISKSNKDISDSIILRLVGSGNSGQEYAEIKKKADAVQVEIDFTGQVNQAELAKLMKKSDLFVLPSYYEGLPVVVLEALACACDVITTNVPGLKDWMGEKINESDKLAFVDLPRMIGPDTPVEEDLGKFEEELASKIIYFYNRRKIKKEMPNIHPFSWQGLSDKLLGEIFSEEELDRLNKN